MNQTQPLPDDAYEELSTDEFYNLIGKELEKALSD